MRKVTDIHEVDDLFAAAREAGCPILAPNYESFTELFAEFTAAQAIADRFGIKRVPLMPCFTLPDRRQAKLNDDRSALSGRCRFAHDAFRVSFIVEAL